MAAYVPKEAVGILQEPTAPQAVVGTMNSTGDVMSSNPDTITRGPVRIGETRTNSAPDSKDRPAEEKNPDHEEKAKTVTEKPDGVGQHAGAGTSGELLKFKAEDGTDYQGQDMLHYLGHPAGDEPGFALGTNGEITRERIRQLARARLAEQERMTVGLHQANFILRQEAAAAMQQKVSLANVTVASKPLYPIGAPRRVRAHKQGQLPDQVQHHHPSLYDGPLNLTSRSAAMPIRYGTHCTLNYSVLDSESPGDLNKPLDLSMKSDRQVAMTRPPKSVGDSRLMHMFKTDVAVKPSRTMCSSTNKHGEVSTMTSAQTMYRPPPMMSYGKAGRHGNGIHSNMAAHYLSMLPKTVAVSESQIHSLTSSGSGRHVHSSRTPVKRPAPVLAHSASDIPVKRVAHGGTLGVAKEHLKVAASSSIPGSLRGYQEPSNKGPLLAYERGRNHAVTLMNQAKQNSQLQIADVRSLNGNPPDPGQIAQARPHHSTAKTGGASIFHHIHHHHHHHHVPPSDKDRLHPLANDAAMVHARGGAPVHPAVLAQSSGGLLPANRLPAHAVPVRQLAGHVITGHDAPTHPVAAPSLPPHGVRQHVVRQHGVMIKHTPNPVSTGTSPHLRRAHYHTRRRHHSISPPTLASSVASLCKDSTSVTSSVDRSHQHGRAMSPLKLVESSIEAGAKMNELLKPLDGPEQSPLSGYCTTNNNKVLVTNKLARPLRVDIPDDRAFISHLGDMSTEPANPVPLVRQVNNAANITKCLTSEVSSSPKKSNSSGNESPTMPVLTPQSVYSPCFATESATNLTHISSNMDPPLKSSPLFYNALTLPLYPRNQDTHTGVVHKAPKRKDDSPPRLQESGSEKQVSEHRVQNRRDATIHLDHRPEGRVENVFQKQNANYILDATVDKNKQEKTRLRNAMREQREAYQRYVEHQLGPLENKDKPRKKHVHSYSLKASMDKMKTHKKIRAGSRQTDLFEDRNIFADLMLQRMRHEAMTAGLPQKQMDVIDLTSSPSLSPAPDVQESNASENGVRGGTGNETSRTTVAGKGNGGIRNRILSAMGETKTLSVGEAIDVVLQANLPQSCYDGLGSENKYAHSKSVNQEADRLGCLPKDRFCHKDQPPKLVKVHLPQSVTLAQASSLANTCPVITSSSNSSVLPPSLTINGVVKSEVSVSSPNSLSTCPSVPFHSVISLTTASVPKYGILESPPGGSLVTSCVTSLPPHLKFSPTEKTFSHDPRKKLLAAMGAQIPSPVTCALSPVSMTASLSSTVSPSSGRSTPSKSSARKRSLEISRLENTSSYVADTPRRKQNVDLLTDPALLDREERALQRAMKRFNEMERREKETPTDLPTDTNTNRKFGRAVLNKQSHAFRRGRGRGRKLLSYQRMRQIRKQESATATASKFRRGFSREIRRLTCQVGRSTFKDFIPQVLEERTRHSQATRSSARERKIYHKNARYEMEIEKEEKKYLERKRRKRSVGGSTSGEEDSSRAKPGPGRRRKGPEDILKTSSESNVPSKEDSSRLDPTTELMKPGGDGPAVDQTIAEEGVAKSGGMDTPLHVVIDPTNHNKMKFMTSSAYELHRKDSGKENKDGDRGETKGKPGGKRKFKTKHLGPATFTSDVETQREESTFNTTEAKTTEVLSLPSLAAPTSVPSPGPPPVKVVKPAPPAEMKRLMVNKKLGETILHRAARLAYDDVAIYCIDYDVVDINAKDNAGYTPLHECCVHGRLRVALHLLQHGADVNASASDGTRPIHDAVDNNWLALVRLLLTYGADPLIATYSGRTTIKLAKTKAMKTFIIGYLADVNGEWKLDEEDPYQHNPDLGWHLSGTHSFDAGGLPVSDIFQDIPVGEEPSREGEFLFEVSETPHLTSYNIRLPNDQRARNWLLLSDVSSQLKTTPTDFVAANQSLRRTTLSRDEFNTAIKSSQLNNTPVDKSQLMLDEESGDCIVEMLELNSDLRRILHIEEEYI